MQISKALEEQQTRTEALIGEAELAQRRFVHMAEAEGLRDREIRKRWLYVVEWGMKERNAELWKDNLLYALEGEDIHKSVESPDKPDEKVLPQVDPERLLEQTEELMVEIDRRLREAVNTYAAVLAEQGMSAAEITHSIAKVLERELPEDDDPFADDVLE